MARTTGIAATGPTFEGTLPSMLFGSFASVERRLHARSRRASVLSELAEALDWGPVRRPEPGELLFLDRGDDLLTTPCWRIGYVETMVNVHANAPGGRVVDVLRKVVLQPDVSVGVLGVPSTVRTTLLEEMEIVLGAVARDLPTLSRWRYRIADVDRSLDEVLALRYRDLFDAWPPDPVDRSPMLDRIRRQVTAAREATRDEVVAMLVRRMRALAGHDARFAPSESPAADELVARVPDATLEAARPGHYVGLLTVAQAIRQSSEAPCE